MLRLHSVQTSIDSPASAASVTGRIDRNIDTFKQQDFFHRYLCVMPPSFSCIVDIFHFAKVICV